MQGYGESHGAQHASWARGKNVGVGEGQQEGDGSVGWRCREGHGLVLMGNRREGAEKLGAVVREVMLTGNARSGSGQGSDG